MKKLLLTTACLIVLVGPACAETISLRDHYRRCNRDDVPLPASLVSCNVIIKDDPKESTSYYERGQVYEKMGKFKEALRDYETAIKLYKPPSEASYGPMSQRIRDMDPEWIVSRDRMKEKVK
jgi:tetratricopeptide (TPR) repeat protein